MNSISFNSKAYNRNQFLKQMSAGMLTAAVLPGSSEASSPESSFDSPAGNDKVFQAPPLARSPLNAPTEQAEPKFYPAPLPPDKRIGYAVVGLGHLALTDVMPAFGACKLSRAVALVSGDPQKASIVAQQYGINPRSIYDYKNFDDIANNKEVDAVYIILPNGMHHEYTIRAARAGKHVLCEKPMANTVKECEEMVDACEKAQKKLMVAYRIQYEPYNRIVQDWVRSREYGNVKIMEFYNGQHIGDPSQWRLKKSLAGGGSLPDVGIYCLNTCRFLIGEEPEAVFGAVYSTPGESKFKEVEETVLFQLHFPGGIRANCVTTYGAHMSRRYRAFTDKGTWFGMDPAFAYKGLQIEFSQAKGKLEWKQHPSMFEKDQFALELDHFSECIAQNKKPYTPGEEGLQDQKIIEAIYRSAREGKLVTLDKYAGLDVFRGEKPKDE
jgi:predicted dehydrogenase